MIESAQATSMVLKAAGEPKSRELDCHGFGTFEHLDKHYSQ
jgi:hypothetical protein